MVDVDDQYPGIPSSVIQRGWKKSPKKTTNQIMKPWKAWPCHTHGPPRHTLWGPGEDMKKPALDLKKPSVTAVDEVSGEGKGA